MSKQEWGNAAWFLFHGLVMKVKDEYPKEYINILYYFTKICNVLPCPDCKMHATESNNKANLNLINSNNKLKDYLWQFHNRVNKRLNKNYFTYEQHNNLYNTVQVRMLLPPFFKIMSSKVPNAMMMDAFYRQRTLIEFNNYIKSNIYKFH
jgi:hypothetical protein